MVRRADLGCWFAYSEDGDSAQFQLHFSQMALRQPVVFNLELYCKHIDMHQMLAVLQPLVMSSRDSTVVELLLPD